MITDHKTTWIHADLHKACRQIAASEGRKMNEVLNEVIRLGLVAYEKKVGEKASRVKLR